jgi:16S rRNA U1498 N3-methylase RsmE
MINNMSFNASKCKVLTVTRKLNPVNFDYRLEDKTLAPVRKEKDLGVVIKQATSLGTSKFWPL